MSKATTKPVDLEKALKGEPVVLRNGTKAYIRHRESEVQTSYPLIGYVVSGKTAGVGWTECGHFYEDKWESEYDITGMWVEPIEFKYWDMVSKDIKYLAKDANGDWYSYYEKPDLRQRIWIGEGRRNTTVLNSSLFPDCDWENSLIERPENE